MGTSVRDLRDAALHETDAESSSDPNDPYREGAFAVDVSVAAQKAAGKK